MKVDTVIIIVYLYAPLIILATYHGINRTNIELNQRWKTNARRAKPGRLPLQSKFKSKITVIAKEDTHLSQKAYRPARTHRGEVKPISCTRMSLRMLRRMIDLIYCRVTCIYFQHENRWYRRDYLNECSINIHDRKGLRQCVRARTHTRGRGRSPD